MTDPLDIAQWAKNWETLARQAGEKLSGNSPQFPWQAAASANPSWAEMFSKSAPFAGANKQGEAVEHMLAGAQGYLGMLQNMAMAAAGQGAGSGGGFADALRQGGFAGAFPTSAMNNPLAAAMRDFGGQGAQGLDQMMERFTATTGPLFDAAKGALNAPAFGHLREKQENMQDAMRLMIDYQEQSARYDRLMLKVSEQSFARFQLKLAEREEPGRQVDSVRGLYDLWIDAAEEAYAEIALSEEFREVYAAVVDAQMRLRKHVQGEVEKFCSQLGMPTRSEVDSIGQRLQALRREFREEREGGADSDELATELDSLRRELAALKSSTVKRTTQASARRLARAAKPARAEKPGKPAAAAKPVQPKKATKSVKAARAAGTVKPEKSKAAKSSPKPASVASSSKSKPASKESTARRAKRRKPATGKASVVAAKSPGKKSAGQSGSFAASIARFSRKTKGAATGTALARGKKKATSRGGSK